MSPSEKAFYRLFKPPRYARWEWVAMRLLMLWPLAHATAIHAARVTQASQPHPVGVAQFADLTWLAEPGARAWVVPASWLCIGLYAAGLFPVFVTAFLLFVHVGYGALANSQGAIHHTTQIVGLVLLAQLAAHLRYNFSKEGEDGTGHLRAIRYSLHAIAAAYVASGISKLWRSGGEWFSNVPNIALQFEKNRQMAYYNFLEKPEHEPGLAMAEWVMANPSLASLLFGAGLVLELTAFMVLAGRFWALLWGVGLIALHSMVSELMRLGFGFNKELLFIFLVNLPFWAYLVWKRGLKKKA